MFHVFFSIRGIFNFSVVLRILIGEGYQNRSVNQGINARSMPNRAGLFFVNCFALFFITICF